VPFTSVKFPNISVFFNCPGIFPDQDRVRIPAGICFTIEPMINAGKRDIKQLGDGWTVVTKDHSLSAQYEHTILVTDTGYEVLTVSDGTPDPA
jgi:methionyl aminopeptidase